MLDSKVLRQCRRCNNLYWTTHRASHICTKCIKPKYWETFGTHMRKTYDERVRTEKKVKKDKVLSNLVVKFKNETFK